VQIRPLVPDDKRGLAAGFQRLSPLSRYRRFLSPTARLTEAQLAYLTEIDHHDHEALVAIDPGTRDGLGVARFVRSAEHRDEAEFAVAVADDWQRRGLGTALLGELATRAREEGVARFTGLVLADNRPVLEMLARLGGVKQRSADGGALEVVLEIPDEPRGSEHERSLSGWMRAAATGALDSRLGGEIAVARDGTGPEILLVHGGASPTTTWEALKVLSPRWTLLVVHRRGYPPSPPGRHDFEVDAADLAPLLNPRRHVVAHSYGALGSLLAATASPHALASLTLIEPALSHLLSDDPEVARLQRLGDAFLTRGLEMDPGELREFLALAGAPALGPGPLPEGVMRGIRRAYGGRLPSEARPQLGALRDAGVPVLVASGDHAPALERVCDAVAERLGASRLVVSGAGHFVASAPGFGEQLERFLRAAEARGARQGAIGSSTFES
jgi:pimeloyl-ACP methyl ester carboxylesterase/GNAT superfamily N-acetyltransferase